MSHDHSLEGHTHEITSEQTLLEEVEHYIHMLKIGNHIKRKALLKLLPNIGDSVDVELDETRENEMLTNVEGTVNLTKVTIVRIEGDALDLVRS